MTYNRQIKVSRASALLCQAALWGVLFGGASGDLASAHADEPWKPVAGADSEGVSLDRRALPGSKFYEYRAQVVTTASPEAVFRGIWNGVTAQLPPTVKQRTMISTSPAELVFYDQLKTKVVSDRDYTIRMVMQRDPQSGVIQVPFGTENHLGPPPAPGYVRVPTIRGNWIITTEPPAPGSASGATNTRVTYLCYSDPGGSIPAFMARGAQQEQVLMDMHRILGRALHPDRTTAAR